MEKIMIGPAQQSESVPAPDAPETKPSRWSNPWLLHAAVQTLVVIALGFVFATRQPAPQPTTAPSAVFLDSSGRAIHIYERSAWTKVDLPESVWPKPAPLWSLNDWERSSPPSLMFGESKGFPILDSKGYPLTFTIPAVVDSGYSFRTRVAPMSSSGDGTLDVVIQPAEGPAKGAGK